MISIHTRLAEHRDLPALAALFDAYRQFYEQAPDLRLATHFIRDRLEKNQSVLIVAEADSGQLLGFTQLYPSFCSVIAEPVYLLYDLFVSSSARASGVGTALLQAAEQHAQRNGYARLDLTTAKTNHAAQALYKSQGWQLDNVFLAYSKSVGNGRK